MSTSLCFHDLQIRTWKNLQPLEHLLGQFWSAFLNDEFALSTSLLQTFTSSQEPDTHFRINEIKFFVFSCSWGQFACTSSSLLLRSSFLRILVSSTLSSLVHSLSFFLRSSRTSTTSYRLQLPLHIPHLHVSRLVQLSF